MRIRVNTLTGFLFKGNASSTWALLPLIWTAEDYDLNILSLNGVKYGRSSGIHGLSEVRRYRYSTGVAYPPDLLALLLVSPALL